MPSLQFPQRRSSEASCFRPVLTTETDVMDLTPPVATPAKDCPPSPISAMKGPSRGRFNSKEIFVGKENQPGELGGQLGVKESAVSDLVARRNGIISGGSSNTGIFQVQENAPLWPESFSSKGMSSSRPLAIFADDFEEATPMAHKPMMESPPSPVKCLQEDLFGGVNEDDELRACRTRLRADSKESVMSALNVRHLTFSSDGELGRMWSKQTPANDGELLRNWSKQSWAPGLDEGRCSQASGDSCDGGQSEADTEDIYGLSTPTAAVRGRPEDAWAPTQTKANMAWTAPDAPSPCKRQPARESSSSTTSEMSNESSASKMSMLVVRRLFTNGMGDGLSSSGSTGSARSSWFARLASRLTWR